MIIIAVKYVVSQSWKNKCFIDNTDSILTLDAAYTDNISAGIVDDSEEILMTTPFPLSTIPGISIEHILVKAITLALIMRS